MLGYISGSESVHSGTGTQLPKVESGSALPQQTNKKFAILRIIFCNLKHSVTIFVILMICSLVTPPNIQMKNLAMILLMNIHVVMNIHAVMSVIPVLTQKTDVVCLHVHMCVVWK